MSRKWISFFTDAGIPSTAAATYALIFSENRISEDMLLDLDREVLKEMGIQTMGDVISILKHARYVYEKTARDTVLQSSSKDKTEKPVKKTMVSTVSVPENDPYFYSPSSELKKATEEKKAVRKEGPVLPPNMKLASKVSSTSSKHQNSDSGSSDKSNKGKKILKRKIKTSVQKGVLVKEETDDSDSSSSSSSSSSLECVSKYRKVLPEPSSKTASGGNTRSSIAKPFSFSGTKRTVSILDKEPETIPKSGTTFTITMSGSSTKTADATKKSIFSRLDGKVSSETSQREVPQVELDLTNVHEEKFSFDDNGLQSSVEIRNDMYSPLVEPYVKSDGRVMFEPVARVKPIIQSEGILANPVSKPKVGPKKRLGITSPSVPLFCSQPSSNMYEPPYNVVNSYLSQTDGMRNNSEIILDDDVFYTNGNHSKKTNFSEILQKKVSIPSMDCEIMEKPSVKNRITFNQPGFRSGEVKLSGLKPLTPRERITMNPTPSMGRSLGSANAASVKSRIAVKSSVQDRISLKSPAPIRQTISLKPIPSIRERIGEKPVPSVKERISLTSTPSIRERIGVKPITSFREGISVKPTTSVRENISLKSTPFVRKGISMKSVTSVRERVSVKSSGSVRERISHKPSSSVSLINNARRNNSNVNLKTPVKDRITAHKGVPVRARLGKLTNINAAKKLNAAKQASKATSVFSRLG